VEKYTVWLFRKNPFSILHLGFAHTFKPSSTLPAMVWLPSDDFKVQCTHNGGFDRIAGRIGEIANSSSISSVIMWASSLFVRVVRTALPVTRVRISGWRRGNLSLRETLYGVAARFRIRSSIDIDLTLSQVLDVDSSVDRLRPAKSGFKHSSLLPQLPRTDPQWSFIQLLAPFEPGGVVAVASAQFDDQPEASSV
jgi:hypothetical protein